MDADRESASEASARALDRVRLLVEQSRRRLEATRLRLVSGESALVGSFEKIVGPRPDVTARQGLPGDQDA